MALRRQGLAAWQLQKWEDALQSLEAAQQLALLNQQNSVATNLYPNWIQSCREKKTSRNDSHGSSSKAPTDAPTTVASSAMTAASSTTTPTTSTTTTTAAPSSSSRSSATATMNTGMPKYQYYQSDQIMTVAILEPNVRQEDLVVTFAPHHLTVLLTKLDHSNNNHPKQYTVIAGKLYASINPDLCRIKIRPEKVLLKLRKEQAYDWPELLNLKEIAVKGNKSTTPSTTPSTSTTINTNDTTTKPAPIEIATPTTNSNASMTATSATTSSTTVSAAATQSSPTKKLARPYASNKDWDSIEKELVSKELEDEKPVGDDAMNQLFQQIYKNADEDTRRAMIKSYQTSGGTVLSTNWSEVAAKDYETERTAPKGMEWKTWEGDKLPMKKDEYDD